VMLKEILKQYFSYFQSGNYSEGSNHFAKFPVIDGDKHSDKKAFLEFAQYFFEAKEIVEISYEYNKAKNLYADAAKRIGSMQDECFGVLSIFCQLQSAILDIDRGIYTGYAGLMADSAQLLKQKTEKISEQMHGFGEDPSEIPALLRKELKEIIEGDQKYAEAIVWISELYLARWKHCEYFDQTIEKVQKALEYLEDKGYERLASDLAPHIHVLKRFNEKRQEEGKLYIENGEIVFNYYATLDYRIREEFNCLLKKSPSLDLSKKLEGEKLYQEEMSDIWSGLAAKDYIDVHKLELDSILLNDFRELNEVFEGKFELRYYTMGIFEYRITFKIDNSYREKTKYDGLSLTGLRHLQSLSTPFALDEKFCIEKKTDFEFIIQHIDERFFQLEQKISDLLRKERDLKLIPDAAYEGKLTEAIHKKLLSYNAEQNRFTLVRINKIVEETEAGKRTLTPQVLEKHFQHMALIMPVREVRSAIDNWIMYDECYKEENFAGIRYNDSEWLSINLYSSVVVLLEQPVWVTDQAIESVSVAGAIINLLDLSNTQAQEQLSHMEIEKEYISKEKTQNALKEKKSAYEAELSQLDDAKQHIDHLLQTIEAGAMMTYPDHTVFMEKIFQTMQLEKYKQKTQSLLDALKSKRTKSMEWIQKINEIILYSQQKVIKLIVAIISVFIALGSMKDLFEIWDSSKIVREEHLTDVSGNIELAIVLIFAFISIVWLLYRHFKIDKHKDG